MRWSRLPSVAMALALPLTLTACADGTGGKKPVTAGTEPAALQLLRQWDEARSRAWASADVAALRSLYVPTSAAGVRDAAMLAAWRDRGLRVEGMQTQLLAARVVARAPDRVVLVVTDRLLGAVAAGHGRRIVLPADRATTRRVTMQRIAGQWRVSAVSAQP